MKRIFLSSIILGGLLCAQCCDTKGANTACAPDGCKVALKITGMTCPMCAASVERSLKKLDGVKAAEVSLEKSTATITVDPTKMNATKIVQAVAAAGGNRHQFIATITTDNGTAPDNATPPEKLNGCCSASTKAANKSS